MIIAIIFTTLFVAPLVVNIALEVWDEFFTSGEG